MRTANLPDSTKGLSLLEPITLTPLPRRPLVSILISNYNYGRYLSDAIQSALLQTYRNLEVIICDDGSTDTSLRILEQHRLLDSRVKVVCQANGGQSLALNAAFSKSAGEIICLLDADDIFLPDKLRQVVNAFAAAPDSGLAVNRMLLVDKTRRYLAGIPSLYDLPSGWYGAFLSASEPQMLPGLPPTSGLSLRRSPAEVIFPLPAALRAYSDTLIQTIAPLVTPIAAIETPLSEYRIHGANIGGVSKFTESRLRNIVLYEREIWGAWRRYLASSCSWTPPNVSFPLEKASSLMDYAYARFRSSQNSKAIYQAIPPAHLSLLPKTLRWYWQAAVMLPGWLFRRSFNFVYGHSRTKMAARRVLNALRSRVSWPRLDSLLGRAARSRPQSKHAATVERVVHNVFDRASD